MAKYDQVFFLREPGNPLGKNTAVEQTFMQNLPVGMKTTKIQISLTEGYNWLTKEDAISWDAQKASLNLFSLFLLL